MRKSNLLIALGFLLSTQLSLADVCPSVAKVRASGADPKSKQLSDWIAYDSVESKSGLGTVLAKESANQYKKEVDEFVAAEWKKLPNGIGRIYCMYRDVDGSLLELSLAKDYLIVENNNHYWYNITNGLSCAAGRNKCNFKPQSDKMKVK